MNNSFSFPAGKFIPAGSHKSFLKSQIPFALLNTTTKVVLTTRNGRTVSEIPDYIEPKEGTSWALINEVWRYTHSPTPGAKNIFTLRNLIDDSMIIQPCTANQYRSEETNCCRSISGEAKIIIVCGEDEEQNTVTNRCRKIVGVAAPAACKEGQERSLDTNHCRTSVKMPNAEYAAPGTKAENTRNWYAWGVIAALFLLAVGYAIWEWHHEIGMLLYRPKAKMLRFARPHK